MAGTAYQVVEEKRAEGRTQVKRVSVTSPANAGSVTLATVTTRGVRIKSVVTNADAAQTADMTTCAVLGGDGTVVTFISTTDAIQANLDATDKQVGWRGTVALETAKTIIMDLQGTGATAVNLTVTITYEASIDGGYLA